MPTCRVVRGSAARATSEDRVTVATSWSVFAIWVKLRVSALPANACLTWADAAVISASSKKFRRLMLSTRFLSWTTYRGPSFPSLDCIASSTLTHES